LLESLFHPFRRDSFSKPADVSDIDRPDAGRQLLPGPGRNRRVSGRHRLPQRRCPSGYRGIDLTGTNATVFNDNAKDILEDDFGRDWFFANLDSAVKDKVSRRRLKEIVDDLD
jgi:hypothetical protein